MELFDAVMRWSHVAAGVIALVVAPVAMATAKGGRAHRRWGRVYFWGMAWIFVSTVGLVLLRPNIFLLGVGTLSFYSAFSADRVRAMKRPERQGPQAIDWAGAMLALAIGAAVIVWGLALALGQLDTGVLGGGQLIFAGLGLFFGVTVVRTALDDIRRFRNPPADRNFWWYHHMGGMLGSYVGAVTAFMVQTVSRWMYGVEALAPFAWVVWVLPAMVGTPLIERWIRSYRQKFEGRAGVRVWETGVRVGD
jgi:hypothetical protein